MGSLFDSKVQNRRKHTPWTTVNLLAFIQEVIFYGTEKPRDNEVVLKARYRHDVASSVWYEIEWTGADGKRHEASAQKFGLMMWRAAQREIDTQQKVEDQRNNMIFKVGRVGNRNPDDPEFTKRLDAHMEAVRRSCEDTDVEAVYEVYEKHPEKIGKSLFLVVDGYTYGQH